ncbi:unnamed protein product [Adineta steineri]|uniref:EGF-like domain-containing protein n=1 Tax=Adineta steineri TaxID=433720 RepID=A0A813MKW1_9BILA|nr:unnamed protein product [Adineta steineri]CAF3626307.1 unnamed protein product [Adineta steineri]
MLPMKHLIFYFFILHLVRTSPQFNLHLTDWINEKNDDVVLQHNCLHFFHSFETSLSHQMISFCMSESPWKFDIKPNTLDQVFTFIELYKQNITSEQLYYWSIPIDIIENYQRYVNQLSIGDNTSSIMMMGTQLLYNCTSPRFGPQCQYSLDNYISTDVSLNEIINSYYVQPYESKILTCYIHLQCNRGLISVCLDWSEICDGRIDCDDGSDEEHCWIIMNNKCKDNEYRCNNGQCISKIFVNDSLDSFDCLDRSDGHQISSIYFQYNNTLPIFENEDIICSWREALTYSFLPRSVFTSSCMHQRHSLIAQAMFSYKPDFLSYDCFLALRCRFNIPLYDNSYCSDFCQNEECTEMIGQNCPFIFYFPSVPIAYGHVYFAYTIQHVINSTNMRLIPPEYICYNGELCNEFQSNGTLLMFDGKICRHIQDFLPLVDINRGDWYFSYVRPIHAQLSHCNKIIHGNNSIVCNNSNMYQCMNSLKCIPLSYIGDGIRDCDYADDEEQTLIDTMCSIDQSMMFYKCETTNKCIHRNRIENGYCDCQLDEYGICDDENIELNKMKRKIRFSTICNNFVDLLPVIINGQHHTDETDCQFWPCNNTYTRCDGIWNCLNGADETDCESSLLKCPSYHHICVSPVTNQLVCLPIEKANDGIIDCLGGTDEPALCLIANDFNQQQNFLCKGNNLSSCITPEYLCDDFVDCKYGDDENFCNSNSTMWNFVPNDPNNSDAQEFFYAYFYKTLFKPKSVESLLIESKNLDINTKELRSSMISSNEHECNRGFPLRIWLDVNKNLSTLTCLCPPSYYGSSCQYQNQRVSLTMQFNVSTKHEQIPFILVISLIDNSIKQIIHSYYQLSYLYIRDKYTKFNIYLLYANRPKDLTKQYSIHIDIYHLLTLNYQGSLLLPLKFPFLPVERISINVNIPSSNTIINACNNHQCIHGECIYYMNDPTHTQFCRCKSSWSGRYCNISYICTCSVDSLCVGIGANNQSICLCPMNKFGSQCLLSNNVCQSNPCQNGGLCVSSDERSTSYYPYVCICSKGFSGNNCEISDTKIILSFHKDIVLPVRSLIYFDYIQVIHDSLPIQKKNSQIICDNNTSVVVSWSHPFHIAFMKIPPFQYYLVIAQNIYHQSSVIIQTIEPLDRCGSINELFHPSIVQMPLIQRIKYYHLPCQNSPLNVSCFYDEVHMCLCYEHGNQRLANCFEFNHHMTVDDFDFDNKTIEHICGEDSSFFTTTSSTSPVTSTSSTSLMTSTSRMSSIPFTSSTSSILSTTSTSSAISSSTLSSTISLSSSTLTTNSRMSSVHPWKLSFYSFILLSCLYIYYTQ